MNIKDPMNSRTFSMVIGGLACLLVALLIFQGGIFVGYHKALFSYHRDDSYRMGVDDPRSIFAPFMHDADSAAPHGAIGGIVSVNLPVVMIKGPTTAEEVVVIGPQTVIRRLHATATTTDLHAGEQVIVIGEPNDQGQIEAALVRILPAAIQTASTTVK